MQQVPPAERFWQRVQGMDDPSGCWIWTGARQPSGHGHIWVGGGSGGQVKAHRMALILSGVEVPDDMFVLHSCDNPPCVNPAHLRIGTNADNMRDMVARDRQPAQMRARTHCRRGHELTPGNTALWAGGNRRCLKCHATGQRERSRRDRATRSGLPHTRAVRGGATLIGSPEPSPLTGSGDPHNGFGF